MTIFSCDCARQITLSACCISVKTPEAVMIRVTNPTTVARMPVDLTEALCRAVWSRSTACLPTKAASSEANAPLAAASPKNRPAISTMMNKTGPIEVIV